MEIVVLRNKPMPVWTEKSKSISFLDAEDIRGRVEISFSGTGERISFNNHNIPQVLAEARLFLEEIASEKMATWRVGFAPFVCGHLEGDSMKITTWTRDGISGEVVEILTKQDMARHLDILTKLQSQFGLLEPLKKT